MGQHVVDEAGGGLTPAPTSTAGAEAALANGRHVTRNAGAAVIECGEFKTVDEVVFGGVGDPSLPGARTLEGFNAVVDARKPQG